MNTNDLIFTKDNEGNIISCSIKKTIFLRLFQKKIRNYLNSRRNRVLQ